jgi:hypothetical protein
MRPARKRAQAIAKGRGRDQRVIIPLAFEAAARIGARPLDEFRNDPTQLANGLGELYRAVSADGMVVSLANEMELAASGGQGLDTEAILANGPVAASLEACSRLRLTYGDDAALLAGVTGPATLARQFGADPAAACECFCDIVKAFCAAGADIVMLLEQPGFAEDEVWKAGIRTADNIARFHQVGLLAWQSDSVPMPVKHPLQTPAAEGVGFITTAELVAPDTDVELLRTWVAQSRVDGTAKLT